MTPRRYKIVFNGEIEENFQHEEVKANLMQVFKLAAEQAEALLKSPVTTIKQDIDHATALKYKFAMFQAGAICHIEDMNPPPQLAFPDRRAGTRRGIMNRRKQARLSSIQPDRRRTRGRRSSDR